MLILVLEASTSSAKALLYRSGAGVVDTCSAPYSPLIGIRAGYEAAGLIEEVLALGAALLDRNDVNRVDMIAPCSIWGHSLVLLDSTGKAASPIKTWENTEASGTASRYRADGELYQALYQRTGCPIHTTYTLWKYIHEKKAGHLSGNPRIASMPDYLFLELTGELVSSTSVASACGFLNIHSLDYDHMALSLAGLEPQRLPGLVESDYSAPLTRQAATRLGLAEGTPVLITGADGCMNQVAAGAIGADIMTVSVGTSAALRSTVDRPILAARPSTWCYVGVEGTWISGSATAGAGNCVDWAVSGFAGSVAATLKDLDEQAVARGVKGNPPVFLPFPAGERCPGWDDSRSAEFSGLRLDHDVYDLYYAVLEGVIFNLRQCYDITVPIIGKPPQWISMSGGIEKSPAWLSMAASIFGLPIHTGGQGHASLLGAAFMALKAGGELSSIKTIPPAMKDRYVPDESMKDFFEDRYQRYLAQYERHPRQQPKERIE
jgi:gluconokinase